MATDDRPDPGIATLADLGHAEALCRRCPLYGPATQVVPGEGESGARLMLVGEQPGDHEDLVGRPFVGPAGRLLDRALDDAAIARGSVFLTNAVKHFKHEMRGKRRLHKRPNAYEIERCRWWLDLERSLVRPGAILAMGATAAQGVLGRAVTISRVRHEPARLPDGTWVGVTIHPSYLLRLRDEADKEREYLGFVEDLRAAAAAPVKRGVAAAAAPV